MSKRNHVVEKLLSIVKDGLHNSNKFQIEACNVYLGQTKDKLAQVSSLDAETFLNEVTSTLKEQLSEVFYSHELLTSVSDIGTAELPEPSQIEFNYS
jgi:hypothetical protein